MCAHSRWRCAYKRESTSIRSRSKSIRVSAITRRNACCSVASKNRAKTTDILVSGSGGQKPRLTKEGKTSVCKKDNFEPLVVPGLSTSSGSNSSETSTSQDLSSTSPVQERSDELVPRRWCGSPSRTQNKNGKMDDSRDADDRLRDLLSLFKILPLSGFNLICARRRQKRVFTKVHRAVTKTKSYLY